MPSMNDKIGGSDQLDLGKVLGAPFKDKGWFTKCLVMGLMMLIPIAGALNLSGWTKAVALRRMRGGADAETLPDANLSYMGDGWRMFLAYLPVVGLMLVLLVMGGGVAGVMFATGGNGGETAGAIVIGLMYLGLIVLAFGVSIVGPAIMFLHIVEDEPWASAQFRRIWEVMKSGGAQYLLFFVAIFIAGMIAQLGVLACYIGMFVTIPLGQAITGAAIAEYARMTKPVDPSFPLEGGTGGSSGSPFGVKL